MLLSRQPLCPGCKLSINDRASLLDNRLYCFVIHYCNVAEIANKHNG